MLNYEQEKNHIKEINGQTIVLTEQVNTKKLKYIIDNFENFFEGIDEKKILEWFKSSDDMNEQDKKENIENKKKIYKTKLENYLKYVLNGEIQIRYKQTELNKGRYFCIGSSLQTHMRAFRHTLSSDYYYDLDMENAHPSLLYQYCEKKGIECENLKDYALNRPKYLKYASLLGYDTKNSQKSYLLKMLNNDAMKCPSEELKPLYKELKTIRQLLELQNPDLKSYVVKQTGEDYYNIRGKIMNHIMCECENTALIVLYNILKQNSIDADVLCFDGIMIRKTYTGDIIELLRFCEKEIEKTTGFKLRLTEKPMNEGFDIEPSLYENINISMYECSLTRKEIKEQVKECVYGDHAEYATFFMKYYGDENIKIFENKKDIKYYHWDEDFKLWKEETSVMLYAYIRKLKPLFDNEYDMLKRTLFNLTDKKDTKQKKEIKKTQQYEELKQKTKDYEKGLKRLSSAPFIKSIFCFIGATKLNERICDTINKSKYELPLKNKKVINIQTMEVRTRTKTDFWSFELDVDYEEKSEKDLKIKDYISSLFKDEDTEEYVSKLIAYMFSGLINARKFFTFYGSGRNGKSMLINIVENILSGNLSKTLSQNALIKQKAQSGARPDLIQLRYSRLSIVNELNDNELDGSMVKTLTGGDRLTCRALYSEEVSFKTQSKILLITNELPSIDTSDLAMLDRIAFIPFLQKFEHNEETQKYIDDIKENLLNTFFSYFIRYFNRYESEGLKESDMMLKAKKSYIKQMNEIEGWINDSFERVDIETYEASLTNEKTYLRIKPNQLWTEYTQMCKDTSTKGKGKIKFFKTINEMKPKIETKKSGVDYYLLKRVIDEDSTQIF